MLEWKNSARRDGGGGRELSTAAASRPRQDPENVGLLAELAGQHDRTSQ